MILFSSFALIHPVLLNFQDISAEFAKKLAWFDFPKMS